jgi:hypothetical protein
LPRRLHLRLGFLPPGSDAYAYSISNAIADADAIANAWDADNRLHHVNRTGLLLPGNKPVELGWGMLYSDICG